MPTPRERRLEVLMACGFILAESKEFSKIAYEDGVAPYFDEMMRRRARIYKQFMRRPGATREKYIAKIKEAYDKNRYWRIETRGRRKFKVMQPWLLLKAVRERYIHTAPGASWESPHIKKTKDFKATQRKLQRQLGSTQ